MDCWGRKLKGELEGCKLLSTVLALDIGRGARCKWKTWSRHLGKCGDVIWNDREENKKALVGAEEGRVWGEWTWVSENRAEVEATSQLV